MPEHNYGKRVCLQCGKEFEALRPAHITCSESCARERRRGQKRVGDIHYRARRKKYLLDLLEELDTAHAEVEWLNCRCELLLDWSSRCELAYDKLIAERCELAARRAPGESPEAETPKPLPRPRAVPQPVEEVAARAGLPELQECPRMRLKAVTLPCGERELCHKPTRCARLGADPDAAIVLEPDERICKQCKAVFTYTFPNQQYCTKECQKAASQKRFFNHKQ